MKTIISASALFLATTSLAYAGTMATGEQISTAISGKTEQGSIIASGVYTESHGADGVIKCVIRSI
jgi:hypothetical protein